MTCRSTCRASCCRTRRWCSAIRKHVVKKTLDLLEKLAKDKPEDYRTFWQSFGTVLKEGLASDTEYREKLGALVRYESIAARRGSRRWRTTCRA